MGSFRFLILITLIIARYAVADTGDVSTEIQEKAPNQVIKVSNTGKICPEGCTCAPLDTACINKGFTDIPYGVNPQVKLFILTSNNITKIEDGAFKKRGLYDIQSFAANQNCISEIHPNVSISFNLEEVKQDVASYSRLLETKAFASLEFLSAIDLGGNKLKKLDINLFAQNRGLSILKLDNNPELEIPEEGPFLNVPDLHELNISNCNINKLPRDMFSGLLGLDTLDLRNNDITEYDVGTFENLTDLAKLILPTSLNDSSEDICNEIKVLTSLIIADNVTEVVKNCLAPENVVTEPIIIITDEILKNQPTDLTIAETDDLPMKLDEVTTQLAIPINDNLSNKLDHSTPSLIIKHVEPTTADQETKAEPTTEKFADLPKTAKSRGLSGPQIDNIILSIFLSAIAIAVIAILIKQNKHKWRKQLTRNIEEPETHPLNRINANNIN